MTRLRHNRVDLALHDLREGEGRPLLLLHGLGECSPSSPPPWAGSWPGPVHALDFTGHGASTVPWGGGYTAEVLMGDADAALAHLGPTTVVGRGLGAYIALLIAGARPRLVRGAILADGPGLAGGSSGPTSTQVLTPQLPGGGQAPDPWALLELSRDVRPPDYASAFARAATQLSPLAWPIAVVATWRAGWLGAVVDEPRVLATTLDDALARYAADV